MNLFVDDLHLPSCENKETGIGSVSEVCAFAHVEPLEFKIFFTHLLHSSFVYWWMYKVCIISRRPMSGAAWKILFSLPLPTVTTFLVTDLW